MVDGFLGRWSQRKTAAREAIAPAQQAEPATASSPALKGQNPTAPPRSADATAPSPATTAQTPAAAPAPTLQDVAKLTTESDFSPFVARAVSPQVRNAAMKKLFADPHFNVMDGLDTYIDDYSVPDPLPLAMLRKMASAKFMQLVDDPQEGQEPGAADAVPAVAEDNTVAVAASATDIDDAESISAVPPDADREPPCA